MIFFTFLLIWLLNNTKKYSNVSFDIYSGKCEQEYVLQKYEVTKTYIDHANIPFYHVTMYLLYFVIISCPVNRISVTCSQSISKTTPLIRPLFFSLQSGLNNWILLYCHCNEGSTYHKEVMFHLMLSWI